MQEAFKLHHGFQRVFCILGMVMMGLDMVLRLGVPDPCATGGGILGIICRCMGYHEHRSTYQEWA
ncbi:2Fe-2S iron-sulfur cluster-binding protein [Pseudomonas syringae]|nr:2Fe-2S iron-sulfur cluster-binding protein [Pseudomonas syringae]